MNLLLLTEQAKVKMEYHARLFSVIFFSAALISLVGIVSLVPAYVSLFSHKNAREAEIAALERSLAMQDNSSAVEFAAAKKEIAALAAGKSEDGATDDILLALRKKNGIDGLRVTSIIYERRGDEEGISLGGEAETRTSLRAFQKALEGEYRFGSVGIPVSNFVKERNIPFTITIALRGREQGAPAASQ
ncbi:MAG: hypothetical protein AAB819_03305 [Patescibacteria group bacterium]